MTNALMQANAAIVRSDHGALSRVGPLYVPKALSGFVERGIAQTLAPDTIRTCDLCPRRAEASRKACAASKFRPISRGALLVSVQRVFLLQGRRILDASFAALDAPQTSCCFEIDGSNNQFDGASSSPDPAESFCNVHGQSGAYGYQPRVFDS